MQDQKLQDYFQFDETDLQANRSGVFSEKQKKELSSDQSSTVQRRRRAGAIFLVEKGARLNYQTILREAGLSRYAYHSTLIRDSLARWISNLAPRD
jgi:hypothetical protein